MPKAAPDPKASDRGPPEGYRPCVGVLLIGPAKRLFIGERIGGERIGGERIGGERIGGERIGGERIGGERSGAWQMPQGGIDPGESPLEAARRELLEEVGTDRAELLAESRHWYAYDLPPELIPCHWGARYRGQSQRWFAFRFTGADADIDLQAHHPEFARWRWATRAEVLRLIVPFKRPVYRAVMTELAELWR